MVDQRVRRTEVIPQMRRQRFFAGIAFDGHYHAWVGPPVSRIHVSAAQWRESEFLIHRVRALLIVHVGIDEYVTHSKTSGALPSGLHQQQRESRQAPLRRDGEPAEFGYALARPKPIKWPAFLKRQADRAIRHDAHRPHNRAIIVTGRIVESDGVEAIGQQTGGKSFRVGTAPLAGWLASMAEASRARQHRRDSGRRTARSVAARRSRARPSSQILPMPEVPTFHHASYRHLLREV
mgnify:CR=1 FL=1